MDSLVQASIDLDLVVSEAALRSTPEPDHCAIFDKAFRYLVQEGDDGTLGRPGFETLTYSQVLQLDFLVVGNLLRCHQRDLSSPTVTSFQGAKLPSKKSVKGVAASMLCKPMTTPDLNAIVVPPASTMPPSPEKCSPFESTVVLSSASVAPPPRETSFLSPPVRSLPTSDPTPSTETPWKYPLKTCRELWHSWFRGDASAPTSLGPLRNVMSVKFPDKLSKHRCSSTRSIMTRIEAAALEFVSANELDAMDMEALDAAFTKAVARAIGIDPSYKGTVRLAGLTHLTPDAVSAMSCSSLCRSASLSRLGVQKRSKKNPIHDSTGDDFTVNDSSDDGANDKTESAHPAAPPPWRFPTLTLREMWRCYFHGPFDGLSIPPTAGPLRHIQVVEPRRYFWESKRVIHLFATCAVDHHLVKHEDDIEKMTEEDSLSLLMRSAALFLGEQANGMLTRGGFEYRSLEQVLDLKCRTVGRRHKLGKNSTSDAVAPIQPKLLSEMTSPPQAPRSPPRPDVASSGSPPHKPMQPSRGVPKGWEFPRTSCRELWKRWFVGDQRVGPFCTLSRHDFGPKDDVSPRRLAAARLVVDTLIDVADTYKLAGRGVSVLPTMEEDELMVVFDRAFDVLMYNNPDGNIAGYGSNQIQPEYAEPCLYSTVARILALRKTRSSKRKRSEL
ncbi:hypothetical protein DYB32_006429 [Aphanomyces invadans]|uniref:Uncharacterized protein n=1 Tax=Aphanomyces invadans TaxID=157072 RepID=A0A418ARK6_9STRA|nr:hypothetical protein DYB32_006429 [Aphanomyces invadans]